MKILWTNLTTREKLTRTRHVLPVMTVIIVVLSIINPVGTWSDVFFSDLFVVSNNIAVIKLYTLRVKYEDLENSIAAETPPAREPNK
ncbi:hypothetical protein ACFQHW_02630 [Lapidilactobacillus achengensis]|uniref:Uncharacterized protein n=1 Tax=Lapidilactobacillus achengensis TaxID=2486000 RepID=A0ABW1UKJ6_9LACO|nr:hypothetical protein [Lapidilactobacillus achengensis]